MMIKMVIINKNDISSQWFIKEFDSIDLAKKYVVESCCVREEYEVVGDNDCHFEVKWKQKGFNTYATTTVYYNECLWT